MFRYSAPQLQVGETLFNLKPNIYTFWFLKIHFIPNISNTTGNDYTRHTCHSQFDIRTLSPSLQSYRNVWKTWDLSLIRMPRSSRSWFVLNLMNVVDTWVVEMFLPCRLLHVHRVLDTVLIRSKHVHCVVNTFVVHLPDVFESRTLRRWFPILERCSSNISAGTPRKLTVDGLYSWRGDSIRAHPSSDITALSSVSSLFSSLSHMHNSMDQSKVFICII